MLDVRKLRLLRELALRGTLAEVAAALNFSPSAVSQQLSALEKEAALGLYVSIISDTGGFRYANTNSEAFHLAAELGMSTASLAHRYALALRIDQKQRDAAFVFRFSGCPRRDDKSRRRRVLCYSWVLRR